MSSIEHVDRRSSHHLPRRTEQGRVLVAVKQIAVSRRNGMTLSSARQAMRSEFPTDAKICFDPTLDCWFS